ncbi:hypothetical protein Areg01_01910 [Actinoplanes regularis]|nr:hypothetical protein Areg01_01910 [Actinoplanes regularis]
MTVDFPGVATGWIRRLRLATGDGAGLTQRALATVDDAKRAHDRGDRAAAQRIGEAAVAELRSLVASGVRGAEPGLVRALLTQAEYLREMSRHAEAVAAAEEAVTVARADPARTGSLVLALSSLANQLLVAGRVREGLAAAREALADDIVQPDAVLAWVLVTLANALAQAGEPEEALAQSERAVGMWRVLAAGADRKSLFQFGQALNNHANRLYAAGRWADAIEFSAESVALFRRLAENLPDKLGTALTNYAIVLSRMGREEEALAAAAEAASLDGLSPAGRAAALRAYGGRLAILGRMTEAVAATTDAVGWYRQMLEQDRDAFRAVFAEAVSDLGGQIEDPAEALPHLLEAVALRRELLRVNRAVALPGLAQSLAVLAWRLDELDRFDEAIDATAEALVLIREAAAANRAGTVVKFSFILRDHVARLENAGRLDEARALVAETVEVSREAAEGREPAGSRGLDLALELQARLE